MTDVEALQRFQEIGLDIRILNNGDILGGYRVTEITWEKPVGFDIDEPAFHIYRRDDHWLAVVADQDTKFERDLCQQTKTLAEAVDFVCSLYNRWNSHRNQP